MMNILINIGISVAATIASLYGLYNYAPLSVLETTHQPTFGTTITTINGSDTLTSSRTVLNSNFSALNTGKFELSDWFATTTAPQLTTLVNLTTTGTITSGTWSGTAIAVAKGGTGTTSPSVYQVLLGNGANGITMASSTGTSGQVLKSNGAGAYPSWQSGTVDESLAYNWTGLHSFAATTTMATTTVASSTITYDLNMTNGVLNVLNSANTATSTISANLRIANNATTTNLFISGNQVGGTLTYTASSTVVSVSSGTVTYTGSIPTNANWGIGAWAITDAGLTGSFDGDITFSRTGKTTAVVQIGALNGSGNADGKYTLTWSGADLSVVENTDEGTDSSLAATIYWYK